MVYDDFDGINYDAGNFQDYVNGDFPHLYLLKISEGDIVGALPLLEATSISLDKLQTVGDQLKRTSLLAFIRLPLVFIERADYRDACSLVQVLGGDFRQLVETDNLDPAGFLLSGSEGNVEGGNRIPLR